MFPPGVYVAGTGLLVNTSFRVSGNKGTWLKFEFSRTIVATNYITHDPLRATWHSGNLHTGAFSNLFDALIR